MTTNREKAPPGCFRERIQRHDTLIGAFVSAPSAELIEIAAYSEFDFAVIDAEHGPITVGDVVSMVRAAQSANIPVLVRVPFANKDFVLRSLDAGADGILVPQVEDAASAIAAVKEMMYPPLGVRGGAYYARVHRFTKDSGWDALELANRKVVTGVMIESVKGVANAAEISQVQGVDFVLFGSTDLSINIGKGPHNMLELENSISSVLEKTLKIGMPAGISAMNSDVAQNFTTRGFKIVVTGLLPLLLKEASRFNKEVRSVGMQNNRSI